MMIHFYGFQYIFVIKKYTFLIEKKSIIFYILHEKKTTKKQNKTKPDMRENKENIPKGIKELVFDKITFMRNYIDFGKKEKKFLIRKFY